jgi:hypothetical protein
MSTWGGGLSAILIAIGWIRRFPAPDQVER